MHPKLDNLYVKRRIEELEKSLDSIAPVLLEFASLLDFDLKWLPGEKEWFKDQLMCALNGWDSGFFGARALKMICDSNDHDIQESLNRLLCLNMEVKMSAHHLNNMKDKKIELLERMNLTDFFPEIKFCEHKEIVETVKKEMSEFSKNSY